jgi:tetratricopeptide (TPR) repeat protein
MDSKELFDLALSKASGGRYTECINAADELLVSHPRHPVFLTLKAMCLEAQGKAVEGRQATTDAIRSLEFTDSDQKTEIAEACRHVTDKFLPAHPSNVCLLMVVTAVAYQLQDIDGCLAASRTLISKDSSNTIGWLYKGYSHAAQQDWSKAIEAYQRATDLDSKNPDAWWNLGACANAFGQMTGNPKLHEKAIEACEKALRLEPSRPEAHYNIGIAYAILEKHREALLALSKAKKMNPPPQLRVAIDHAIRICESEA